MDAIQEKLQSVFGYRQLTHSQEKAVRAVLEGQDTFVLLPTGGGKSLCYQLPALLLPHTTLVISPLIALMKEQVAFLKAQGVAAEYLNSTQSAEKQNEIIDMLQNSKIKVLYLSAEKATQKEFLSILKKIPVSLIAVDEAHCISSWGHDFRPDYTRLGLLRAVLKKTPVIALTATADEHTRQDVLRQLELNNPLLVQESFDRPNIYLEVQPAKNRVTQIKNFITLRPGQPGIIYCLTRKKTEELSEKLQGLGISSAAYHAGMTKEDRAKVQTSFQRNKIQVVCATIAFGMGIDKANIRFVIHYNLPKNIEGYYQELGRAGRDGQPAHSLLLYSYSDVTKIQKFFINRSQGSIQFQKLQRVKDYAQAVNCRRKVLLQYFGEELADDCGKCDICDHPLTTLEDKKIGNQLLKQIQKLAPKNQALIEKNLLLQLKQNEKFDKYSQAELKFFFSQLKNLGYITTIYTSTDTIQISDKVNSKLPAIPLVALNTYIQSIS